MFMIQPIAHLPAPVFSGGNGLVYHRMPAKLLLDVFDACSGRGRSFGRSAKPS